MGGSFAIYLSSCKTVPFWCHGQNSVDKIPDFLGLTETSGSLSPVWVGGGNLLILHRDVQLQFVLGM